MRRSLAISLAAISATFGVELQYVVASPQVKNSACIARESLVDAVQPGWTVDQLVNTLGKPDHLSHGRVADHYEGTAVFKLCGKGRSVVKTRDNRVEAVTTERDEDGLRNALAIQERSALEATAREEAAKQRAESRREFGRNLGKFLLGAAAVTAVVVIAAAAAKSKGGSGFTDSASVLPTKELLLFGGVGHDIFLGCVTCEETSSDSVRNPYGSYGSRYSATSIINPFAEYGSKYSDLSACNKFATHPPAIVDRSGAFYGYLTLNAFQNPTNNLEIRAWLQGVCESR